MERQEQSEIGNTGKIGVSFSSLVNQADRLRQIRKKDLSAGDRVVVKTSNSIYSIRILNERDCVVSGGWFDRKGLSPMRTNIVGCTWGGSAIKIDTVAACGLCLEFGNRVKTTSIKSIFIFPAGMEN